MKLDQTDFDILEALQNDARISNKELARLSGVSQSTCLERVRRLRENQVLTRFHADVNPDALGISVEALLSIRLRQHADIDYDELFNEIILLKEVVNVYLLAGAVDLMVHVAVPSVQQLRELVVDTFSARYEISQMETSLIYRSERCKTLPNYLAETAEEKSNGKNQNE